MSEGRLAGVFLICLVSTLLASGSIAMAHKVSIFAWVEDDMVYTQSKSSGGKTVKHATVEVYDSRGNRLLHGKTDEAGEFAFKIPKETEMKIVLLAGTGHRGEWVLPVEEVRGETPGPPLVSKNPPKNETESDALAPSPYLSEQDIERIVEKTLDKKLKPVMKMLVDSKTKGPAISEIIGGIGYILGLMGLGAYVHYRRKKNE